MLELRRAQPWLGTLVEVYARHHQQDILASAIDAAFAEIARLHRLLSVHDAASELSQINRHAQHQRMPLSVATRRVLSTALRLAEQSEGRFDPSIGGTLARHGLLPVIGTADPAASWRDIDLNAAGVRFKRALRLDFGGIAKGYAVDCALAILQAAGCDSAQVNAGGDLARFGNDACAIQIRGPDAMALPALSLRCGAVATSYYGDCSTVNASPLIDPQRSCGVLPTHCISVCAPSCLHADALTKVVMLAPDHSDALLQHYQASALIVERQGDGLQARYRPQRSYDDSSRAAAH